MIKPVKPTALPPGIVKADLERKPNYGASAVAYKKWHEENKVVEPRQLTMYETERFGWCITTLLIGGGRGGYTDRFYGINLKGEQVRMGRGPHVKQTITVHLRESRLKDLQQYIDLYNKGLVSAHETRDVISTRRARTEQRRRTWGY